MYRYCPNPRLTPLHNACRMLQNVPPALLLHNPLHSAFHNLCDNTELPKNIRTFLGLGLNFCPNPQSTTPVTSIQLERIRKDYYRRIMFSGEPRPEQSDLYIPDPDWYPKTPNEQELIHRMDFFHFEIRRLFSKPKRQKTNLLPSQRAAFVWLMNHPEIIVCASDKNLGPAVMERSKYLRLTHRDHLSDTNTYRRLDKPIALARLKEVSRTIESFGTQFPSIPRGETKYIKRKLDLVSKRNETSFLYINPKIHKTPLKTRPIISYCGSLCEGLAQWTDLQLKKIIRHLPYVATSSTQVKEQLTGNYTVPETTRLFTLDAVSMYTNIHAGHALPEIADFLYHTEMGQNIKKEEEINVAALIFALETIMENNIFMFGDTYWIQTAGTAMGTPPAPPYATLYFAIHEIKTIKKYPEIGYYSRYIDDGLGTWTPKERQCRNRQRKV